MLKMACLQLLFEMSSGHLADEEEDLFPLLLRCCPWDDTFCEVINLLRRARARRPGAAARD